jgi:hypothetical protein
MNSHELALEASKSYIGKDTFCEIAYRVPFGFDELQRRNVTIDQFLDDTSKPKENVALFHILLGCDVSLEKMIRAISKAVREFDRVIVLEHNKNSADWNGLSQAELADHCIANCVSYTDFESLCYVFNWRVTRSTKIAGDKSDDRNFIYELGQSISTNYDSKTDLLQRLRIPHSEYDPFFGFTSLHEVYLGTADHPDLAKIDNKKIMEISPEERTAFVTCGNFFGLDHMDALKKIGANRIVMFDVNPFSIEFCQTVFCLIRQYPTLKEFVTNYLLCQTDLIQIENTPLTDRIRLYLRNWPLYNETSKKLFLLFLNANPKPGYLEIWGAKNCNDSRTDKPGNLYLRDVNDFRFGNSLKVSAFGWSENEESYSKMRDALSALEVEYNVCDLRDLKPSEKDIVVVSNIFGMIGHQHRKRFLCKVIGVGL